MGTHKVSGVLVDAAAGESDCGPIGDVGTTTILPTHKMQVSDHAFRRAELLKGFEEVLSTEHWSGCGSIWSVSGVYLGWMYMDVDVYGCI